MLFKPDLAQKVMTGEKTQTRRVQLPGDEAIRDETGRIVAVTRLDKNGHRRLLYHVDFSYTVQPGRGKKGVGRATIAQIRDQRVQDISEEDARAEGVNPMTWTNHPEYQPAYRVMFWALWDRINAKRGYSWESNPRVWAITFAVVGAE